MHRLIHGCLSVALAIAALSSVSAISAPTDCVEDAADGRAHCGSRYPTPWDYHLCDENSGNIQRTIAWCIVRGGTWMGTQIGCPGQTPDTEGNIVQRSIAFSQMMAGAGATCSVSSDTGWGATFPSNFCTNSPASDMGHLIRDARRLITTCQGGSGQGEQINARKLRTLVCPAGYSLRNTVRGQLCARLMEPCDECNAAGNPITVGTGVKMLAETDYQHARGLTFTRHYHSFKFYEPYSNVVGSHSTNQLGVVWRSNFDKRVIPVTGSVHVTAALTLPNGEVQYFNSAGNEIYNYRGGRARLVSAPTGHFYLTPDTTEFYGTDGRLRTITSRTGYVLTLEYTDGTTGPNGGFQVDDNGNPTTLAAPANLLRRVVDSYGNALSFAYSADGRLIKMTDPGGGTYLYSYDAATSSNLTSVKYPDTRIREYRYNEPANMVGGASIPYVLTSVVDENNSVFATYKYNSTGSAVSTEHAGGAARELLTYNGNGTTTVTDPLGTARTFGVQTNNGVVSFLQAPLPGARYGGGMQSRTLDASGNPSSVTDFNGVKTCYSYDTTRNLETVRVEGVPSATSCASVVIPGASLPAGSRKILTEWHPRWRMPARTSEPGRRTTYAYNGDSGGSVTCAPANAVIPDGSPTGQPIGVLCSRSVQSTNDPDTGALGFSAALQGTARVWTHTYDELGKMLTQDGPRTDASDVTTYTYYPVSDPDPGKRGGVATITNALSHVSDITSYNAHGQPLSITDPNGLVTTLAYDARQRLTSRSVGGETTTYTYDNAGQLTRVTLPDASFLDYTYDNAHRLTAITDNLGNKISYTLDLAGNRTLEEVRDPANQLAQTRSRVYNNLNRLTQEIGAQGQTTAYGYDNQGNLTSIDGPLAGTGDTTTNTYDALNRLIRVTDPHSGQVNYGYNGLNQLTSVSDPRSLTTSYTYDGLNNLNQQVSPDTGTTVNTYDAAGNLLTQLDAKGQTTTYTYDALNRVTSITYQGGVIHTYAYDQGTNGKGRLTQITEPNSTTSYVYDQKGRLTSETRTINSVAYVTAYEYDSAGRMNKITYPSGREVTYTLDSLGRINQIVTAKGGINQTVLSNTAYRPFGPAQGFTFGNGQTYTRGFDTDGRVASYTLGTQSFAVGYDLASRIGFISDAGNPSNTNTYTYDNLDRLTNAVTPGTPYAYTYDGVGNRLTKTVGSATDTYAYSGTSNRLSTITPASGPVKSIVFDANGSTTNDAINQYSYDTRGRMVQAVSVLGTTDYKLNSLGQRIRKTNAQGDTVFHYDAQGRLIAESNAAGAVQKEYIYLGDIPVAVLQ